MTASTLVWADAHLSGVDRSAGLRDVHAVVLSEQCVSFVEAYGAVAARDAFLWQWVIQGLRITQLASVAPEWSEHVLTSKWLGVMFDVLLDDVADERQDMAFLDVLLEVPFGQPGPVDASNDAYFALARRVWQTIDERVRGLPRYAEFAALLAFDVRQLLNCMRHSVLVATHPDVINLFEHDLYAPHNMHMMVSGTIDLMASPGFDRRELGALRTVLHHGQMMGRIGNVVSTWEREVIARDPTSAIAAHALTRGVVSAEEYAGLDPHEVIARIEGAGIAVEMLGQWRERRDVVARLVAGIRSVDLSSYLSGLETLLGMHLASRGMK